MNTMVIGHDKVPVEILEVKHERKNEKHYTIRAGRYETKTEEFSDWRDALRRAIGNTVSIER